VIETAIADEARQHDGGTDPLHLRKLPRLCPPRNNATPEPKPGLPTAGVTVKITAEQFNMTVQSAMLRSLGKALSVLSMIVAFAAVATPMSIAPAAAAASVGNEKATRQLFQAIYANDMTAVQSSVDNGADVEARDRWGMTPAEVAIDRGNYRIAHFLVSVRNTRRGPAQASARPAGSVAGSPAATQASPSKPVALPAIAAPVPSTSNRAAAQLASKPVSAGPAVAAAGPKAPAQPNPFDPAVPAFGSQLLRIDGTTGR